MVCVHTSLQSVNVFKEKKEEKRNKKEKNKIPGGLIFARPIFKNSHLILLRKFDTCLEILISVC